MIKFYYSTAPNPMKVALCLEEMGLAYEPMPIDTRKSQQHKPEYLAINPNAKVPAIALPWGFDGDGLPFAVQLVTRVGTDEALLSIAARLEVEAPDRGRRPPLE